MPATHVAAALLAEAGALSALANWDTHDFGRVHGLAQIVGGVDQRNMRQRLREIAGLPLRLGVVFFREQADVESGRSSTGRWV